MLYVEGTHFIFDFDFFPPIFHQYTSFTSVTVNEQLLLRVINTQQ